MRLPDYEEYRLAARRRHRVRMLVLWLVLAAATLFVVAACGRPTAPSDSTKACPKGRTDCSPYVIPGDTIHHP